MEMTSEKIVTPPEDAHAPALLSGGKRTRRGPKRDANENSFQFVNVSQQPRHHVSDQAVIRSQAMRSFLRTKQKAKQLNKKVQQLPLRTERSVKTQHKFRLGPWGIQELATEPRKPKARGSRSGLVIGRQREDGSIVRPIAENASRQQLVLAEPQIIVPDALPLLNLPVQNFGAGKVDPFDSLPIPASERTQFLLSYSHTQITSSPLMAYPKRKWFWLAFKDAAYFHAALSHYSGHLNLSQQRGDPHEAVSHRMEAVKIINDRLGTSTLATSDGTIGAISCMINYEANNGTLESVRTHVMGLEQIVKLRGGMQGGAFGTNLHRLVSWADINSANALSTLPLFPSIDESGPDNYNMNSSHRPLIPNLHAILTDLRCLSSAFPRGDQRLSWCTDSMWYADILYNCKRSLIFLSHTLPQTLDAEIIVACSHAAAILVEVCFRGVGINAGIVDTLLVRLKGALELALNDEWWRLRENGDGKRRTLFWAFCIGGIAAVRRSEGAWFVAQTARFAGLLNVSVWKEAENILEGVLWHSVWSLPYKAFWNDVNGSLA